MNNEDIVKRRSSQKNILCPQKGIPSAVALHRKYEAQVLTYLQTLDKRVGLLIDSNVVRSKEVAERLI